MNVPNETPVREYVSGSFGYAPIDDTYMFQPAPGFDVDRAISMISCLACSIRDAAIDAQGDIAETQAFLIQHAADTIHGLADALEGNIQRKAAATAKEG